MGRIPTITEISYASGFFDGEGSVTIESRKLAKTKTLNWRISVRVSQNVKEPLELLKNIWGGSICERAYQNDQKSIHFYQWSIHTRDADKFLRDIQPYSIVKKEHIRIALEFRDGLLQNKPGRKGLTLSEVQRREFLKEAIKSKNRWANSPRYVEGGL